MEAIVEWKEKNDIRGFVKFSQSRRNEPVQISVKISGLENGFHGFHGLHVFRIRILLGDSPWGSPWGFPMGIPIGGSQWGLPM